MFNLITPLNLGERPCDRALADSLMFSSPQHPAAQPLEEDAVFLMTWRVWKDFGIARDDRRIVPLDPADRALSPPVRIIERYAKWPGKPGAFVQAAIDAGFFLLVKVDAATAQLILTDFFPANRTGASDMNASKIGGSTKARNHAMRQAKTGADEQLQFFRKSDHSLLRDRDATDVKDGLLFIHQLCGVLRKQVPQAQEWQDQLLTKALAVRAALSQEAIERTFTWFIARRGSQEIPDRLDFILDQFVEFSVRAEHEIR